MADYKILLGVMLNSNELSNVRNQIESLESNPIKLKIDSSIVDSKVEGIKQELASLGGKGGLKFDTSKLEASLNRVATDIGEIRTAFGTLNSKSGMGNLLTSINQISTALDNASKQFVEFNAQLNSLTSKNFSVNIGLNMGKSAAAQQSAYGDLARGTIIPQLKQQVSSIVQAYNTAYGTIANEQEALIRLVQGTKLAPTFIPSLINDRNNNLFTRMGDGSNLKQQIAALKEYIALFEQAASIKNPQLASSISGASQTANKLETDAKKAREGVTQLDNSLEQLKGVLGSGIDAERLSTQLDNIVADLKEISKNVQVLSQNASLTELTTSFNNLSTSIEKMLGSATQAKNVLGDGLNTSAASAGTQRAIQEQNQLAQTTAQTANTVSQSGQKIQQAFNQMASASNLDPVQLKDDTAEVGELTLAVTRLKQIMAGIGKIQIGQIGVSKGVQELQVLENQLNSLSAEYNETVAEINRLGGMGSQPMQQMRGQMEATTRTIEQLKARITGIKTELAGKIQGNFGGYEAEFTRLQNRITALSTKTPELKTHLDGVRQALDALKSANGYEELKASNDKYLTAVQRLKSELMQLEAVEKGANSSTAFDQQKAQLALQMSGWLRDNSAAAKQFGGEIQKLQVQLKNLKNDSTGLRQIKDQFKTITMQAKEAGVAGLSWGDRFKKQLSQYSTYLSGYMLFSYAIQGLRSMFEQVKSIDSAMTELKKVTDESADSYNRFLSNAATRSKEIGTTIDGLVSSTADFARLGYSFEDSQGLAEVANIYAVVGDEIEGVEGATESLISTMAAFNDAKNNMSNTDFAMSIIDKFNEVGNNFAISSGGIGEAMERSASSLMAANNTIDESIALITAANTVVDLCNLI